MPKTERSLADGFQVFSTKSSHWVGSKWAFALAVATIVLWAVTGPYFRYSDTWQLVVNTATTVVTFLIVFLIQNTQNRDARAIHLKLEAISQIIRAPVFDLSYRQEPNRSHGHSLMPEDDIEAWISDRAPSQP